MYILRASAWPLENISFFCQITKTDHQQRQFSISLQAEKSSHSFLGTQLTGLLEDMPISACLHHWIQCGATLQNKSGPMAVKMYLGCWIGLLPGLTWMVKPKVQSILEWKCWSDSTICNWNIVFTWNVRILARFLFTQNWAEGRWMWRPFPAHLVRKYR